MAETRDETIGREAALLHALCHAGAQERAAALARLAGYRWNAPDHRVIFEVLAELGASEMPGLREELARRLTRKGFPEVDLETIFARAPAPAPGKPPQELARELLGEAGGR